MAQNRLHNTPIEVSSLPHLPSSGDFFHSALAHECDHSLRILVDTASQVASVQWTSTDTRQQDSSSIPVTLNQHSVPNTMLLATGMND